MSDWSSIIADNYYLCKSEFWFHHLPALLFSKLAANCTRSWVIPKFTWIVIGIAYVLAKHVRGTKPPSTKLKEFSRAQPQSVLRVLGDAAGRFGLMVTYFDRKPVDVKFLGPGEAWNQGAYMIFVCIDRVWAPEVRTNPFALDVNIFCAPFLLLCSLGSAW